ncbi:hypothetical protein EUTSA_v10003115mg [Eutrema salsugineum]|uniref:At3g05675-like ankyrin-like domain-containing protein n=1 Tax=Eutrema salsugineum TaxID=72664 RepID=V4MY61_EUTSA|nr:hypothetical protein EUTSA_v10003115mg [Eutrema salsugineum]
MASREVSAMTKQGFISNPSLSPSRTTALSKPSPPNHLEEIPHARGQDLDGLEEQRRTWQREAEFGGQKRVHSYHGCAQEGIIFMEKMKSQSQSHTLEISECDDVEVFVETVVLMHCEDLKNKLIGENVIDVLSLLKVSSAITFEEGLKSCLEYLEAVPWSEDEEESVVSCIEKLDLPGAMINSVLQRVSSSEPYTSTSITNEIFLKLLTGVLQAKDNKARQEMKSVIFRLIREEADHDVSKDALYSLCHRCLLSLILCLSDITSNMNDPGDFIGETAREASNLLWIVDILIEKKICDEFVQLWADQKELANLHSKIPAMYRHEISKITAQICVGIGRGKILVKMDNRFSALKTWLEVMYNGFWWMRRASTRSVDWKVVLN